jgi:hypothetical protein
LTSVPRDSIVIVVLSKPRPVRSSKRFCPPAIAPSLDASPVARPKLSSARQVHFSPAQRAPAVTSAPWADGAAAEGPFLVQLHIKIVHTHNEDIRARADQLTSGATGRVIDASYSICALVALTRAASPRRICRPCRPAP